MIKTIRDFAIIIAIISIALYCHNKKAGYYNVPTKQSTIERKIQMMGGIKYFADKNRPGNCFAVFDNINDCGKVASITTIDCDRAGIE